MDRFPLDSALVPTNFVLVQEGHHGLQIRARAREKNIARLALKAMAHTSWPAREHEQFQKCWYKPIDDPELADVRPPLPSARCAGS